MKNNTHPSSTPAKQLGIIGCGWLGKATAKVFQKEQWKVAGTFRSESSSAALKMLDILPTHYVLGESSNQLSEFLAQLRVLLISVPPGLRKQSANSYGMQLTSLCAQLKDKLPKTAKIIFVSSTGVYPNSGGPFSENTIWKPETEKTKGLLQAEKLIQELPQSSCILRLAGLVGENRKPVLSLSKKPSLDGGFLAANLIHQTDAAQLILHLANLEHMPPILNGVYPQKIKKGDFYKQSAEKLGVQAPHYTDTHKTLDRHIFSEIEIGYSYGTAP